MRSRGIPAESDALGLRNDTGVGVNASDDGDGEGAEGAAFACVESCCSSASELQHAGHAFFLCAQGSHRLRYALYTVLFLHTVML